MRTYIANIIPRIQRFSRRLDELTMLTNQHWVSIDHTTGNKTVYIFDSNGEQREVEGEGVVGVQPILQPGEQYQYISACNLRSEMGKMQGSYRMMNADTHQMFSVKIPPFEMIAPSKLN